MTDTENITRRQQDDLEGARLVQAVLALRGDQSTADSRVKDADELTVGG